MPLPMCNTVEKFVTVSKWRLELTRGLKLRMNPQWPDRNRYTGLLVLVLAKGGYE